MKLDSSAIVTAIIGAACTGLVGGIGYCLNDYFQHPDKNIAAFYVGKVVSPMVTQIPLYVAILIGITPLLIGWAVSRVRRKGAVASELAATTLPSKQPTNFKILEPRTGQKFPGGVIKVRGTWVNKPIHPDRMVVLSRRGNTYWPQREANFVVNADHTWTCQLSETHRGDGKNDVTIIIARLSDQGALWVQLYEKTVRDVKQWVGLDIPLLPDSIVVDDLVIVQIEPHLAK